MAKFIVVDGLDGCGKATQVGRLAEYFRKKGYHVHTMSFPNYDSLSSSLVKMYLNGEFGDNPNDVNPYVASSFYAVDRFAQFYKEYFKYFKEDDNTIILADRYLSANIIHQTSKCGVNQNKYNFVKWVYEYECTLCGLPREDITILLTIPPAISQALLSKRYDNDESKKDIHEGNLKYLEDCYNQLSTIVNFINTAEIANWKRLDCATDDKQSIKPIDEITNILIKLIETQILATK